MTRVEDTMLGALTRLTEMVDRSEVAAVAELTRRMQSGAFRVLVVGEAKRGKSTLVNALLQREVLPTGVAPLTSAVTTVASGSPERVRVTYLDGREVEVELARLAEFVTEAQNPGNVHEVVEVTVLLEHPLLSQGLELVDTPGTGSVYEQNSAVATDALKRADAALFVLTSDPPISAAERAWLAQVRDHAVEVLCVLNKADYLEPSELEQSLAFTRSVLAQEFGRDVPVWPVSARLALRAGPDRDAAGAGWNAFVDAFGSYLSANQRQDLLRSVAQHAGQLCTAVAERSDATAAALSLSQEDLQHRLEQLQRTSGEVERARFASAALARASLRQLLEQVNADAALLPVREAPELLAALGQEFKELQGGPAQLESAALLVVLRLVRAVIESWREHWTMTLDAAVAALDSELTTQLEHHVETVRQAVSTLFDLDLPAASVTTRQTQPVRFTYTAEPDVGQTELLAGAVRSRLPGRWGRRRVERYVYRRAADQLDRYAGRARSELADRLRQTERVMLQGLDEQFAVRAGGIVEAVERAGHLHAERNQEVEPELLTVRARAEAARQLEQQFRDVSNVARRADREASAPLTPASSEGGLVP